MGSWSILSTRDNDKLIKERKPKSYINAFKYDYPNIILLLLQKNPKAVPILDLEELEEDDDRYVNAIVAEYDKKSVDDFITCFRSMPDAYKYKDRIDKLDKFLHDEKYMGKYFVWDIEEVVVFSGYFTTKGCNQEIDTIIKSISEPDKIRKEWTENQKGCEYMFTGYPWIFEQDYPEYKDEKQKDHTLAPEIKDFKLRAKNNFSMMQKNKKTKFESVMESFNLDPLKEYAEAAEDFIGFEEVDVDALIQEAATGATKKNVFQKIWEFIKNIVNRIRKAIRSFIKWVKSKFGPKSSATEIISSTPITANSDNDFSSSGVNDIPYEIIQSDGSVSKQNIKISDSGIQGISLKYQNDHKYIMFIKLRNSEYRLKNPNYIDSEGSPNKINKANQRGIARGYILIYSIIKRNSIYQFLYDLFNRIENREFDEQLSEILNRFNKEFVNFAIENETIEMSDLSKVDEVMEKIQKITEKPLEGITDSEIVDVFNRVSDLLIYIQFALNDMMNLVNGQYIIDKKYIGSCHKLSELDEVIYKFISNRIPTRYVIENTLLLTTGTLMSDEDESRILIPGQGRASFIMGSDKVCKFATNRLGIRDNKVEYNMYSNIPDEIKEYITSVYSIGKFGCTTECERVTPIKGNENRVSFRDLREWAYSMETEIKELGYEINDINSMTGHNIGFTNDNKFKIFDFGQIEKKDN